MPEYLNAAETMPSACCYVTVLLILVKALNLVFILVQLQLLTKIFAHNEDPFWAFSLLLDILAGRDSSQSGMFPRVFTFCFL